VGVVPSHLYPGSRRIPLTLDYDSQDMVLCRRLRGLGHRIAQEGEKKGLKCQVKYWAGAWEVEEIFAQLSTQKEFFRPLFNQGQSREEEGLRL